MNVPLLKGRIVSEGYTQKSLAQKLEMSENTMSSKLSGETSFTLDQVEKICELLHINSDQEKCAIFLP